MDKREFIAAVTDDLRVNGVAAISQATVEGVLASIASVAARQLEKADKVRVPGLAVFTASNRAERTTKNPKTGAPCVIPARRCIRAKPVSSFSVERVSS